MSKYGEAYQNYFNAVSALGARAIFQNPDDPMASKDFITARLPDGTLLWKQWSKTKPKKKLKRKTKKPSLGIRRQEEDEALRGALGGTYGQWMSKFQGVK